MATRPHPQPEARRITGSEVGATGAHSAPIVTPWAGTRLGRYEVLAELASGGMASVFIARAVGVAGFQRLVAVKALHPHLARETEFISMFLDEARLAARIHHPNVVATLDISEGQGGYFIVMDYIEGDSLAGLFRRAKRAGQRIPLDVVLRVGLDAINGLHAAHELTDDAGQVLKLVHRDVSPQNVIVGIDGVSRLTDFGVARAESRLSSTRDGQFKGKLAYMAPEQIRTSRDIDRRADIFAMGVVLWECMVGERLFKAEDNAEILNRVLNEPIPKPADLVPSIPPTMSDSVMYALERDRELRYATASDFAQAIEDAAAMCGLRIASPRAVGQFVAQISSEKLETERERVRTGIEHAKVQWAQSSREDVISSSNVYASGRGQSQALPVPETGGATVAATPRSRVTGTVALSYPPAQRTSGAMPAPEVPPKSRVGVALIGGVGGVVVATALAAGAYFAFFRSPTEATVVDPPASVDRVAPTPVADGLDLTGARPTAVVTPAAAPPVATAPTTPAPTPPAAVPAAPTGAATTPPQEAPGVTPTSANPQTPAANAPPVAPLPPLVDPTPPAEPADTSRRTGSRRGPPPRRGPAAPVQPPPRAGGPGLQDYVPPPRPQTPARQGGEDDFIRRSPYRK
ncbi:MAG: serine/threonine protein kinase [Deltaproteobacteria bacterium]|nr:serine/threonine protein kinase [Deltaproteobacteria bacterium]